MKMESFETTINTKEYASNFAPSERALRVLREGRIISQEESSKDMIERVVHTLLEVEKRFGTSDQEIYKLEEEFGSLLDGRYCVMSTPILTNAGRYLEKPLSVCTVPSLDLVHDDIKRVKKVIFEIHQDGMGTGFNLDEVADPVATLRKLNHIAIESALSGKEDRPVGNMATLTVYHPKILEFINAKVSADDMNEEWKFNISVDCDADFFKKLESGGMIILRDGKKIPAKNIFDAISQAANTCAEVGLAKGESCQFAYINLSSFLGESGEIDLEKLKQTTHILTRMLDNALEISIDNYSEEDSKRVMSQKRKIGISKLRHF